MLHRLLLISALALAGCGTSASADSRDAATDAATDVLRLPDLGPDPAPDVLVSAPVDVPVDVPVDGPMADFGPPVVAPANQWTWVDVPGSVCANGTATGFGLNPAADPTTLLIFLQGGGACWDGLTCYGIQSADHLSSGYGTDQFAAESPHLSQLILFNRSNARNPWHDANLVYVPYCTGDVHGGDRIVQYNWGNRHARTFGNH